MPGDYFPHLNVQTNSNLSFSLIKISKLVDWAGENKLEHLAIADYYPYEFLYFYNLCKEKKIKPIIGAKVIIQDGEKQYSLVVYPQNSTGYKDLIKKIFSANSPENRIFSLAELLPLKSNCLLIFVAHNLNDIVYFSQKSLFSLEKENKTQFYIGFDFYIQEPKKNIPQKALPLLLPFFSIKGFLQDELTLLRKIASLNQYFLTADIQQKSFPYLNEQDFFSICTKDRIFYKILLSQLNSFLHRINLKISVSNKIERKEKDLEELQNRCERKLFFLAKAEQQKYENQLEKELKVISKLGYTNYFLTFSDIVNDLRQRKIVIGPGRGSSASSLVTYLLGITKIDPLEYNLFFERFLNEKRKSLPDIDIDVEDQKRTIAYLQEKYGQQRIARVATRQKLGWKNALKESAEIFNRDQKRTVINEFRLKEIIGCVKDDLLNDSLKTKALQDKFSSLFQMAEKIKDFYFNSSLHASGIIISEKKSFSPFLPLKQEKDCLISYHSEKDLNLLGLKKYDFLNLTSLGKLNEIKDILKKDRLPKCNLQDKSTWRLLSNGLLTGIPQLDTVSFRELIGKFQPQNFADLVLILALNRPGARRNIEIICQEKNQTIKESSSPLDQILAETYGFIVFEEQISQILVLIFDYSFSEAEIQRRKLSQIKDEELEKLEQNFLSQANKKITSIESKKLWNQIISSNSYTFNKAHAVAYSYLSYYFAFLKANYFFSLITYFLNNHSSSPEKTLLYLQEAVFYGFTIHKPDINFSEVQWSCSLSTNKKEKLLIMGFSLLKDFQESFFKSIIEERKKGQFGNWENFIARTNNNCHWEKIESTTFRKWVTADLFASLKVNKDYLLKHSELILRYLYLKKKFSNNSYFLPHLNWPSTQQNEKELDMIKINAWEWENFGIYVTYFSTWQTIKKLDPSLQTLADALLYSKKSSGKNISKVIKIYAVIQSIQPKGNFFWLILYDLRSSLKLTVNQDFYQKNQSNLLIHQPIIFSLLVKFNNYKVQAIQVEKMDLFLLKEGG